MANTLVELTEKLFRVTRKKCECNCSCGLDKKGGRIPLSSHADDCALILLLAECRTQAHVQLYGLAKPQPDPPADEQGLTKAIEACKNYATLKELTHQYCRDRWKAQAEVRRLTDQVAKGITDLSKMQAERDEARTTLEDTASQRRDITLELGDRTAEVSRLQERFSYVNEHRGNLVATANSARIYLEQAGLNPDLQSRLLIAATNHAPPQNEGS